MCIYLVAYNFSTLSKLIFLIFLFTPNFFFENLVCHVQYFILFYFNFLLPSVLASVTIFIFIFYGVYTDIVLKILFFFFQCGGHTFGWTPISAILLIILPIARNEFYLGYFLTELSEHLPTLILIF